MSPFQPTIHNVIPSQTISGKPVTRNDPEHTIQALAKVEDTAPDGGYGWVVVGCVFLINSLTWGINSSYGVFLAHYLATNTYSGATPLQYAFVGGLSVSMCEAVSPIATLCIARLGTRATLMVGIFFETAALLGASWSTQIWHLFLSQGVCFGWGMGFLFVGSVGLIPQWFDKKRSFANSIGAAGSGIGGLVFSLASNAMIQNISLGWAFRILAVVTFTANGICTMLIRDRNVAVSSIHHPFSIWLLKRPEFLLLLGWGVFSLLGYIVLLFSLPNYAQSIGLTPQQGAVAGALLNLGQGLGRPFVGFFSDTAGRINIALLGTLATSFFCFVIWIFTTSYGVLLFFSLLVGIFAGTYWATIPAVAVEIVGLKILPSALSIVWLSLVIPSTFSEPIGLHLKSETGNVYLRVQLFAAFMYTGAGLCLWFLRAWKIGELQGTCEEQDDEKREVENQNDDELPHGTVLDKSITWSSSVPRTLKYAKWLWIWQRV